MRDRYPSVTIIILNWNGITDTLECLKSLTNIQYPNYKIVIVDNGSSGDDINLLQRNISNPTTVIKNDENLGYAGGINSALSNIDKNKTDYVLLLNNDTIVDKSFLNELVTVAETNNNIGICGSLELSYDNPKQITTIGCNFDNYFFIQTYPCKFKNIKDCKYNENHSFDLVAGSSMLIRTSLFNKIGLFDKDYFIYGEEFDFSLKVKKSGFKSVFCPTSVVWHKSEGTSGGRMSKTGRYYLTRNRILFAKKNFNPLHYVVYLSYYLSIFIPIRLAGVILKGRNDLISIIIKATWDGINFKINS